MVGTRLPALIIFANWVEVCKSFGFDNLRVWPSQHPIIVILLLYGGAMTPLIALSESLVHSLDRATEAQAGMSYHPKPYIYTSLT